MNVGTPNLQIMIHFYTCTAHRFKTVTMYPEHEQARILDEIVRSNPWYGGRFAVGHREEYMKKRLFVEARMYEDFAAKYAAPTNRHPVYFYLRPCLDLDGIERGLQQRRKYGESGTKYLLLDLDDIAHKSQISFTLFDSHRSYAAAFARATSGHLELTPSLPDQGTVFHIDEIADVYTRNRDVEGLSFEVQIWDPSVLRDPCARRGL